MAKTRMLCTDFWSDSRVDTLDPIEKLLYIYLFTNDKSSWSWATELSFKKIWYETWIDRDMVWKIIKRFEEAKKIKYVDWYLILKNFIKHHFNGIDKPTTWAKNNQIKAMWDEIKKLPDNVYIECMWFISFFSEIVEKTDGLYRVLEGACEGIIPSPLSSTTTLPSPSPYPSSYSSLVSLDTTTPSVDKEYIPSEITKKVDNVIATIKRECQKNWIIYASGKKERNYAKHLLSEKFGTEALQPLNISLDKFIERVIKASVDLKYSKKINNSVTLYYNRSDVVNRAIQEKTKSETQSTSKTYVIR